MKAGPADTTPIRRPYRRGRLVNLYICQWCGWRFYPDPHSGRKFCSVQCSGKAHHAAADARNHPEPMPPISPEAWADFKAQASNAIAALRKRVEGMK